MSSFESLKAESVRLISAIIFAQLDKKSIGFWEMLFELLIQAIDTEIVLFVSCSILFDPVSDATKDR